MRICESQKTSLKNAGVVAHYQDTYQLLLIGRGEGRDVARTPSSGARVDERWSVSTATIRWSRSLAAVLSSLFGRAAPRAMQIFLQPQPLSARSPFTKMPGCCSPRRVTSALV